MGLKLTTSTGTQFYEKVFGPSSPVTKVAKKFEAAGVQFETEMYVVSATFAGKTSQVALTKGTTSLMKGSLEPAHAVQNKGFIEKWMLSLHMELNPFPPKEETETAAPIPMAPTDSDLTTEGWTLTLLSGVSLKNKIHAIKTVREHTGWGLKEAKTAVEIVEHGEVYTFPHLMTQTLVMSAIHDFLALGIKSTAKGSKGNIINSGTVISQPVPLGPPSVPVTPTTQMGVTIEQMPLDKVIPLRDAKAIGQKVKGTTEGSVYHTVAVNKRVKVAAKIMSAGAISIRAEWTAPLTTEEKTAIQQSGMSLKGDSSYASIHLDSHQIAPGRIIGAFVLGLGLEWDQVVKSSKGLVIS